MKKYILIASFILASAPLLIFAQTANADSFNFNINARSACVIDLSIDNPPISFYQFEYTTSTSFFEGGEEPLLMPVGSNRWEHFNLKINSGLSYLYHAKDLGFGPGWIDSVPVATSTLSLSAPNPSGLKAAGKSYSSGNYTVELSWTSPALSDDYGRFEVYRSTDGTNFTKAGEGPSLFNGNFVDDNGGAYDLDPAQIYYYKVRNIETDYGCAEGDYVSSAYSNTIKVPAMPTGFTGVYQFSPSVSRVNLSWTAGGGQNYYEVYRATSTRPLIDVEREATFLPYASSTSDSFVDNNPQSGPKYYKVRSCTNSGCSGFTNFLNIVVADSPQYPISNIYYVGETTGNVVISWDNTFPNPPSSGNYLIYRATYDGGGTIIFPETPLASIALPPSTTTRVEYRDVDVPLNHIYFYRIRADFGGSPVAYSNYSVTTGINLNMNMVLSGQAWASTGDGTGVGWISFSGYNYNVKIDKDGLFSGAAWAAIERNENYGWLSFNQSDLIGCPSGTCEARYSSSTKEVSGWARFLAPTKTGSENWDGWVSLKGTNNAVSPAVNWGISYNVSKNFVGTAWGGDIVGWISFTKDECGIDAGGHNMCKVTGTPLNQPSIVSNVRLELDSNALCAETPAYRVAWDYSDPENDFQNWADVKIIKTSDGSTATSTQIRTSDNFTQFSGPIAVLGASEGFSVSVRTQENSGKWSEWADSNSTTTPAYYYPIVNFTHSPTSSVSMGRILTFTDTSVSRGGGAITERLWEFNDAVPQTTSTSPTRVIVRKVPLGVNLTATNSSGDSCTLESSIDAAGSAAGAKRRIFRER
jgi:hypothetical protein